MGRIHSSLQNYERIIASREYHFHLFFVSTRRKRKEKKPYHPQALRHPLLVRHFLHTGKIRVNMIISVIIIHTGIEMFRQDFPIDGDVGK